MTAALSPAGVRVDRRVRCRTASADFLEMKMDYEKCKDAFDKFVSLCEETCRHDLGESDERLILEWLEYQYGVPSSRYCWNKAPNVEFSGGAPLHGAASAATEGYASGGEK